MGHQRCCVVNCKNTGSKQDCKFYKFPVASWKLNQRIKWIAAVKRQNVDGSPWDPKPWDHICSDHFIGGKKSDIERSPSYVPTIFPSVYKRRAVNESLVLNRDKRCKERTIRKEIASTSTANSVLDITEPSEIITDNPADVLPMQRKLDRECQVNTYIKSNVSSSTFVCNRYFSDKICDAEIQTDIFENTESIITNNKKFVNKECGTSHKTFTDQETQANNQFAGFSSITKDEQLIDLAGVTFNNFNFLLNRTCTSKKYTVCPQNRLLIFLMKLKLGLTFSALGVLFNVHRTTISRIFYEILELLVTATANLVFWPNIDVVQATMPECFHPDYSNTRVIIDCTEFNIEIPASVDNRVYCYSHYKKNFTAKLLIGILPSGFICLKSKVAGGRKSDSQMTIESGLLNLLEDGDIVLADKGFPEIKTVIDASGKKVKLVMPPFLEKKMNLQQEKPKKHTV